MLKQVFNLKALCLTDFEIWLPIQENSFWHTMLTIDEVTSFSQQLTVCRIAFCKGNWLSILDPTASGSQHLLAELRISFWQVCCPAFQTGWHQPACLIWSVMESAPRAGSSDYCLALLIEADHVLLHLPGCLKDLCQACLVSGCDIFLSGFLPELIPQLCMVPG